jgi:hypothetical protein
MAKVVGDNGKPPDLQGHFDDDDNFVPGSGYHPDEIVTFGRLYWGTQIPEAHFVASLRNIERMYVDSPVDKVAIRVTDYLTPALINATWMPYQGEVLPEDEERDDVFYLVIRQEYFFGNKKNLLGLKNGKNMNCLLALPGLYTNGEFTLFVTAAEARFGIGIGNTSGNPGLRLPPPP